MNMERTFERVAIVNRGEPAMRFINAAREINAEGGPLIRTIALYSEPDRRAMFVREADERHALGPATFTDEDGQRKSVYLDYGRLERALRETRAEAVWVGWGFVAEHPEFADLCDRMGVVFIGPDGEMMRRLGDKIESKRSAERAEVPIAPWSGGPVASVDEAREHAERLGYPLMIKATAGGGGRGIRKVRSAAELADAFESARSEARKAFGDATVFMEKLVTGAHHVEVQVIADGHGTTWALGVRDCSIQRRNQKLLEETPCPVLSEEQHRSLQAAAVRLTRAIGYRNAGTVEFLYDPANESFSFLEVNARLQVEHPVTEMVTGVDLVKLQVAVARGERLPAETPPVARGHAIEVRLNAEDPDRGFTPAPGLIERLRLPVGPGIRVDTGVAEGDDIPSEFDSMVGKIIAYGSNRQEALARLRRALYDTAVVIKGGACNNGFLLELLERTEVQTGELDVAWLDGLVSQGTHRSARFAEIALLQAAIDAYDAELAVEQLQFYQAAARGRPRVEDATRRKVELSYGGTDYEFEVACLGADHYRLTVAGAEIDVAVDHYGDTHHLQVAQRSYRVRSVVQGLEQLVEVEGTPHRISRERGGIIRAPSPAVVVSMLVRPGDQVDVGDRLVVLEAMKMEIAIEASFAGRVREVRVGNNVQVSAGAPLVVIESVETEEVRPSAISVDFASLGATSPTWSRARTLAELRALLLGYDADPRAVGRALAACTLDTDETPPTWAEEDELLATFVDVSALLRRRLSSAEDGGEEDRTPEDYFFTYLRDPGARHEELPASFREKLARAVARYGVQGLDPSPQVEAALFRLFKSHHRIEERYGVIAGLLQRRLDHARRGKVECSDELRQLLTNLARSTSAVSGRARELQFTLFERPLQREVTTQAYSDVEAALDDLSGDPSPDERTKLMARIIECPYPLSAMLTARSIDALRTRRQLMLEALGRRHYRICRLENIEVVTRDGFDLFGATYSFRGAPIRVLCLITAEHQLSEAISVLRRAAVEVSPELEVAADLYVSRSETRESSDATAERLRAMLEAEPWKRPVRRIVVALSGDVHDSVEHFTFRRGEQGFREERVYRGLHPMMSRRLQLWRLKNFEMERLPSTEDVFLFRVVARDNPKDERLIALAEVRDLTPVRGRGGELLGIPHLEHVLSRTLAALRTQQVGGPHAHLYWNRVHLFVWPTLSLPSAEVNALVRRLAPQTRGLGIERVLVYANIPTPATGQVEQKVIELATPGGGSLMVRYRDLPQEPLPSLTEYEQKVVRLRRRGLIYPYELITSLTPRPEDTSANVPPGEFVEYDLDESGALVPVDRPPGGNTANVVVGLLSNVTEKYPEGMTRVAIFGDPSMGMGSLAEPECRRILAALDLAQQRRIPVEWFAVSAGAKISMQSGTENMDWIAAVLRRLVEFTQADGEVNLIVCGVNVGAQPYFNAEATMLMHTRGILIMVPGGSMVLTGKQALDYSGGVSAEDNEGIGGYERIMGPNGQAQYAARDIAHACQILMRHYDHAYVLPGEPGPRRAATDDPVDRDVCDHPHGASSGIDFATIGDVFSESKNPGRKKPFEIRKVMKAVVDQDHAPLERWSGMRDAETAVVWDAHIGGYPVSLLGIESRPIQRLGFVPADGPTSWTSGTLFPASSKKVARAINAASSNRPVVVLANLSGFDGSPESMRNAQLEFGAEIGRAVVNFRGPMVFCVISRYHGGAFVVFSNKLNDNLEIAALEGTFASVIGGAPAAAVVFAREVERRTREDPRVLGLERELADTQGSARIDLEERLSTLRRNVHAERMREVAEEFDGVHSIQRAKRVGSVQTIVDPHRLRPYLVDAITRGLDRYRSGSKS